LVYNLECSILAEEVI